MDVLLGERTTDLMGGCMWPGHRALRYYLSVPVRAMKTWVKGVYVGQEFAVNNIFVFIAVNHDLRSMTIQVSDRDPRYAIQKL